MTVPVCLPYNQNAPIVFTFFLDSIQAGEQLFHACIVYLGKKNLLFLYCYSEPSEKQSNHADVNMFFLLKRFIH